MHYWQDSPLFLAALVWTLERVFPTVTVWASSGGALRAGGRSTFAVLASRQTVDRASIEEPAPGTRIWTVLDRVPGVETAPLLSDDYAPVDRLTLR